MEIQVLSDLHTEFWGYKYTINYIKQIPIISDYIVLAGDIFSLQQITVVDSILDILNSKWKKVYYILGNHEYYNNQHIVKQNLTNHIKKFENIVLLQKGVVDYIEGYKIIGDTLWFKDDPMNDTYSRFLSDFRTIKDLRSWVYKENTETIQWFEDNIDEKTIVVSHHMPSNQLIDDIYKDDNLNRFFVCDLDDMIYRKKPYAWIYGHTHCPKEIKLYNTITINNSLGYGMETKGKFDIEKVLTLSS